MTDKEFQLLMATVGDIKDAQSDIWEAVSHIRTQLNNFLISRFDTCPMKKEVERLKNNKKENREYNLKKGHLVIGLVVAALGIPSSFYVVIQIIRAIAGG